MAESTAIADPALESIQLLVKELSINPRQIMAVAHMLAEGNTIPFIARYRKEIHGNLDEVQISKSRSASPITGNWKTAGKQS